MGYETRTVKCRDCNGRGEYTIKNVKNCVNCRGKGKVHDFAGFYKDCPDCGGRGWHSPGTYYCSECGGSGKTPETNYRCDRCRGYKNVDQYSDLEQCSCPIEEDYNDNIVDRSDW